jgi:hypothetical protein
VFLCPSDGAEAPVPDSAPVNYVFCTGDGANGGEATGANGAFILGRPQSMSTIRDGASNTVAASEQVLGIAGPSSQAAAAPGPVGAGARHRPVLGQPPVRRRLRRRRRGGGSTRAMAGGTAIIAARSTTTT